MNKHGNRAAGLLLSGLVWGCVHGLPHEPFPWDDEAPIVTARRVDVLEAEAAVARFLRARGAFGVPVGACMGSARAYEMFTSETPDAYQVFVRHNPTLCDAPPDQEVPPPVELGPDGGPAEYAVSKKDLRIISVRLRGDKAKAPGLKAADASEVPGTPPGTVRPSQAADAGGPWTEGDLPEGGDILPRWQLPDTYHARARPLGPPPPDGGAPATRILPEAAPAASALAFTTAALRVTAGACAGPVRVETRDSGGSPVAAAAPLEVDLVAVPPSAVFFSDARCTTALPGATVGAGSSGAEVYFRATQAGPLQIGASAAALASDTQTHTVDPGRAVSLIFTTPPHVVARGVCSSAVTAQARDALDNPASVPAQASVQLVATPKGSVTFYQRPGCQGAKVTRTSIPAHGDSTSFYFKSRLPRRVTIAVGLGSDYASQEAVITPGR